MAGGTAGRGKTALITGASSGIGLELARRCARAGFNLVLVARGEAALRQLAAELEQRHGVRATVLARDLADPASPPAIRAACDAAGIGVDVLVNNAGFASYGPFSESDLDVELQMIQVNTAALTQLTRLFLDGMLARRAGRILNIASTAAFQPGPLMAVYYATKAYVLSFSEALANELRGSGVTVTALCPGPTASGFQQRAAMEDSKLVAGKIAGPAEVARAGYAGLMKGQTIVIPGARNKALVFIVRLTPRNLVTRIVRRMQERV